MSLGYAVLPVAPAPIPERSSELSGCRPTVISSRKSQGWGRILWTQEGQRSCPQIEDFP